MHRCLINKSILIIILIRVFIIIFCYILVYFHLRDFLTTVQRPLWIIWSWTIRWMRLVGLRLQHYRFLDFISILKLDRVAVKVDDFRWNLLTGISCSLAIFNNLRIINDNRWIVWHMRGIDWDILVWICDGILFLPFLFEHVWALLSYASSAILWLG